MFRFGRRPIWAIHNPLKAWTLAGLSLREAQLLVASMSDTEMKVSFVHCRGWGEWRELQDEACNELFLLADQEYQLPVLPQVQHEDDHEITEVRLALVGSSTAHEQTERRHPRYLARLPAEIITGSLSFSTHTVNFSEGGFCFEDPLPDWVAGYFIVSLKAPGRTLEFTCSLVEDQKKEKFRTEIIPTTSEEDLALFRQWIAAQNFPKAVS